MSLAAFSGCARDPEPLVCPPLEPGDIALSEIRGAQAGGIDNYGQWIELVYLGSEPLDLRGLAIRTFQLDGSGEAVLRVRVPSLEVVPGQYVVLGHHGPEPEDVPFFVDATFFTDFASISSGDDLLRPRNLHDAGVFEVEACNVVLDRVIYRNLPDLGTWSFDGAMPPDPQDNDDESAWCNDDVEERPEGFESFIGVPGTPGQENRPCA